MEIINHQLISGGVALAELPRLPRDAQVRVWAAPVEYQSSGYFVSTDNSIPACDHGEPVFIATLAAAADAIIATKAAETWESIKAERDQRTQTGGYYVAPHWYHSDQFSRIQQLALVLLAANIPAGTMWKTLDNGLIEMT